MNLGAVAKPNAKGQIVIPKNVRDTLGINEHVYLNLSIRGSGLYLYPIRGVITDEEKNTSLTEILEKTRGVWAGDSWPKTEKRRKSIEAAASKRRKRAW